MTNVLVLTPGQPNPHTFQDQCDALAIHANLIGRRYSRIIIMGKLPSDMVMLNLRTYLYPGGTICLVPLDGSPSREIVT
jgi:hypothetical protein